MDSHEHWSVHITRLPRSQQFVEDDLFYQHQATWMESQKQTKPASGTRWLLSSKDRRNKIWLQVGLLMRALRINSYPD